MQASKPKPAVLWINKPIKSGVTISKKALDETFACSGMNKKFMRPVNMSKMLDSALKTRKLRSDGKCTICLLGVELLIQIEQDVLVAVEKITKELKK